MAENTAVEIRKSDRRLFAMVAIVFPIVVLIGFAPTYYLKPLFSSPPIPSKLVHLHGIVMGLWILLFVVQVFLIRSRNVRLHMTLGRAGVVLGALVVITGFFTGVAAAKYGSNSNPPGIPPLVFLVVPVVDVVFIALFLTAAVWLRKRPADHKRLILLLMISLLPPAVGRFPFEFVLNAGPLFFFGIPSALAIAFIVFDRIRNGIINKPFVVGAALLVASYPARLALASTGAWLDFATWLTTWAA